MTLCSFPEILDAFNKSTLYAPKWAKAWHTWALFNTAVMSHYIQRGQIASEFVVAAVTGYFHSIACAANAKGVDDSLQVQCTCFHGFSMLHKQNPCLSFLHLVMSHRLSLRLATPLILIEVRSCYTTLVVC